MQAEAQRDITQNHRDDELSLIDVMKFFNESWKTIAGFVVLGIAAAILFILFVPKQYEASAQIKMAQIANHSNLDINNNTKALGVNIEEPQALIARMALPTSYPKEIIVLCGMVDERDAAALAKKVKLAVPKGLFGTVDLKVRDGSKEIAKACTNGIFQLIKVTQANLIAPYLDEARNKLIIEQERLSRATEYIARADKSGGVASAAYLATREEIRYLLDQITILQNIVTTNERRTAYLTAPIYLNDQPVFPQKRNSVLVGLLLGSFLGLLLALARKLFQSPTRLS